jgi:putative membrane protein
MPIVRRILWTLLALVIAAFVVINWGERHDVIIWPAADNRSLLFEWPIGFTALVFFLLGAVPTWLYHRGVKWQMSRRIKSLENAFKANSVSAQRAGESPGDNPPNAPGDPAKTDLTPQ